VSRRLATDSKALRPRVRKARRARAPASPSSGEGEGGWVFDEIGNLVEATERPPMEGRAGSTSHGWRGVRPERPGQSEKVPSAVCHHFPQHIGVARNNLQQGGGRSGRLTAALLPMLKRASGI
jgi:hypothetical protein